MLAKEIMSKKVITISKDKTVHDAARLMKRHDIGALPVVEDEKLIGIITESDIFKKIVAKNLLPSKITVKSFMTKKVVTAPPDIKVHEIDGLLFTNNIRRILIVDDKRKVIGIVSASDLIRQAYHWKK